MSYESKESEAASSAASSAANETALTALMFYEAFIPQLGNVLSKVLQMPSPCRPPYLRSNTPVASVAAVVDGPDTGEQMQEDFANALAYIAQQQPDDIVKIFADLVACYAVADYERRSVNNN